MLVHLRLHVIPPSVGSFGDHFALIAFVIYKRTQDTLLREIVHDLLSGAGKNYPRITRMAANGRWRKSQIGCVATAGLSNLWTNRGPPIFASIRVIRGLSPPLAAASYQLAHTDPCYRKTSRAPIASPQRNRPRITRMNANGLGFGVMHNRSGGVPVAL